MKEAVRPLAFAMFLERYFRHADGSRLSWMASCYTQDNDGGGCGHSGFVWEDSQADGLADHVCPEAVIIVVDPEPDPVPTKNPQNESRPNLEG